MHCHQLLILHFFSSLSIKSNTITNIIFATTESPCCSNHRQFIPVPDTFTFGTIHSGGKNPKQSTNKIHTQNTVRNQMYEYIITPYVYARLLMWKALQSYQTGEEGNMNSWIASRSLPPSNGTSNSSAYSDNDYWNKQAKRNVWDRPSFHFSIIRSLTSDFSR